MTTEAPIQIRNLGKKYRLASKGSVNGTLRDWIAQRIAKPFNHDQQNSESKNEFWALKDVSLDIEHGEIVGLIGHNGAGKSTLLKILSRITPPSTGAITMRGRVGALLEVGSGFHPELSGRENIYMNGAILGMKRHEVKSLFDEIVAFAEVEKFLDMPIKHYSSGMFMRLAFSVAAHLKSDILLVDEVLAVGDLNFQQKCLEKMEDVGSRGRTVVLVSHNMASIARLCKRAILLEAGRVVSDGPATETVVAYMRHNKQNSAERVWDDLGYAPGNDLAKLRAVRVLDQNEQVNNTLDIRFPITIEIEFDVLRSGKRLSPFIFCNDHIGNQIFLSADWSQKSVSNQNTDFLGRRVVQCVIPGNLLAEGFFSISAGVTILLENNNVQVVEHDVVSFQMIDPMEGDSARGVFGGSFPGIVRPLLNWSVIDRASK